MKIFVVSKTFKRACSTIIDKKDFGKIDKKIFGLYMKDFLNSFLKLKKIKKHSDLDEIQKQKNSLKKSLGVVLQHKDDVRVLPYSSLTYTVFKKIINNFKKL